MTKRTRLFLIVSGGILVFGLGTGLMAAYVGGFQNLTIIGSSGPDELAYVPSDARVVAYANVREIMDSELHQKLKALQPRSDDGLAKFEAETGVDVTRDVDYVLAVLGPGGVATEPQGPPLVLVRGRFDEVRVEGLVRSKGGEVGEYKGQRLFSYREADHAGMGAALAFLEPGLIAMGGDAAVRGAIDVRTGAAQASTDPDLMRLIKEANEGGNAWAVARFDAIANGGRLPADMMAKLPAINWVSVTGHVNGGLRAAVRAETRDDAAAKNLRDVLNGMLALAKLQTGQRAELDAVINSIELSGEGKNVSLGLAIPMEAFDQLAILAMPRPGPDAAPDADPDPNPEPAPAP
jgi:hypothetical protein